MYLSKQFIKILDTISILYTRQNIHVMCVTQLNTTVDNRSLQGTHHQNPAAEIGAEIPVSENLGNRRHKLAHFFQAHIHSTSSTLSRATYPDVDNQLSISKKSPSAVVEQEVTTLISAGATFLSGNKHSEKG